jgi:AcrR family transcriptional regulator
MRRRSGEAAKAAPAGARAEAGAAPAEKLAGEKVFDAAADLFYRESIRSVGVETIVERAGVAKISLYRSFASKDDLIVAYLKARNAAYWRDIDRMMAERPDDPRAQLRALIRHIASRATRRGYRGCPFINYAAEFPDPSHPGHRVVAANKREMRRRLSALARVMGAARPAQLADALFLLIEGAYAGSQTLGGRHGPAAALPRAADVLITGHVG